VHEVITVHTAAQLSAAMSGVVFHRDVSPDIVVMAAAVADFRPAVEADAKISKVDGLPSLELAQNEDILATLVRDRGASGQPIIVGFAAETVAADRGQRGSLQELAEAKLARKGCNVIVANDVSEGRIFGEPTNSVVIVSHVGDPRLVSTATKGEIAHAVWDIALEEFTRVTQG
jgi:phosphopantothenoylcysteine decarboxylase/phosphopantothenate--cysteine ligase